MTDYELIYLFSMTAERLSTVFMDYVTILFAFLVAAFLVAPLLSKRMIWFAIGSYVFVQVSIVLTISSIMSGMIRFLNQLSDRSIAGNGSISWLTDNQGYLGGLQVVALFFPFFLIAIVLASIWFLFEQRNRSEALGGG